MRQSTQCSGLVLAFCLFAGTALGTPITVTFSGTIDSHTGAAWPLAEFAIGQAFTGQYVFESTTPGNPSTTMFGGVPPEEMPYPNAVVSITVTSGGGTFTNAGTTQNGILIQDNYLQTDAYIVEMYSAGNDELYLDLRSTNVNTFTSKALPLTLPPVSTFDNSAFFRIAVPTNGQIAWAQGNLDGLAVVVPEPAMISMTCAIFLCLGVFCHRDRK